MITVDRHTVLGILHKNEKDRLFFVKKFNIKKCRGSDVLKCGIKVNHISHIAQKVYIWLRKVALTWLPIEGGVLLRYKNLW